MAVYITPYAIQSRVYSFVVYETLYFVCIYILSGVGRLLQGDHQGATQRLWHLQGQTSHRLGLHKGQSLVQIKGRVYKFILRGCLGW